MPRIFDNIDQQLLPALKETLNLSDHADFCVGYFNLRGWKQIDARIKEWAGGPDNCCRLMVGMQRLPQDTLREALSLVRRPDGIDNASAIHLKKQLAEEFREQLMVGVPTNDDEAGLRRLAEQIRSRKVVVKLFLRHPLHAKLYLLFRPDPVSPIVGYLGSSNLTLAGLSQQGELNVDVVDNDASQKLAKWFVDRWDDRWCIDISKELVDIINESWAREELVPPYYIYLKMAYHLSQEARVGLTEFRIPKEFGKMLFDFQIAAVKIAAHHLNRRGGVLIGDVVGLGKTLMATAVAKIFEDDHDLETLILCPKNLVPMWEDHRTRYRLRGQVKSISRVSKDLSNLRRYRLVLLDESHNLRNREGKRYRAIQEYIRANESKVILLSATPYNKTYLDLANQLRLFIPEDADVGIRPEQLLRELGETEFIRRHQCPVRSLAAFEKSPFADDWRELMRLYMVRRTRSFIQENYADTDQATGRKFLTFADGTRSYFPSRQPKTVTFKIDETNPDDQYAALYSVPVVDAINKLKLPRYGLGNYIHEKPHEPPTPAEAKVIADLSRAGKRLMGFCRTNLFKRLESSGQAFLQSVERHILDGEAETEVDLGSYAYQIWKNAIDQEPALERIIQDLPDVVYGTRSHTPTEREPEGVLLYVRTAQSSDALAWVDRNGQSITESQFAILKAAACEPNTPALPRRPDHHLLVRKGVESIAVEEKTVGGQLGRPSGARFRTYERLKRYAEKVQGTLFDSQSLRRAIEDIYNFPLRQVAVDTLNRQLRSGIQDDELARRVVELREEGRLCVIHEEDETQEPHIICSLGLAPPARERQR